jgi:hypothetical protein
MTRSTGREAISATAPEGAESEREMKNRFAFLCLVAGVLALAVSGSAWAQSTVTGAPPLVVGNAFSVTLFVPSVVGVSWNRNVYFDLSNTNAGVPGSCGTYPPAPATATPCYWEDSATLGGALAAPMAISLFSNTAGNGNLQLAVQANSNAFVTSNATIGNVYFADGLVATPAAGGAPGAGYTQMSSAAPVVMATTASPTAGWVAVPNGRKFIFQVNPGLTATAPSVITTALTVSLP